MPLLVPSVEMEVARNFCNMLQDMRLAVDDRVMVESLDKYFCSLADRKNQKLIDELVRELVQCHPGLLEKTSFYQSYRQAH